MSFKNTCSIAKETVSNWSDDKMSSFAAALAYYTIFSLGPLIIICIAIASVFIDRDAFQNQIIDQFGGVIGSHGSQQLQTIIDNSNRPANGFKTTLIGIAVLVFGASGLFGQLQLGLNVVWHVKLKPDQGFIRMIKTRVLSFAMVLVVAFLLLISSVLSIVISAFSDYLATFLPQTTLGAVLCLNFFLSLGIVTVLFAMIFKILPDVHVEWRDVWLGAFVTAVLFALGRIILGVYFSRSDIGGAFGAAGSLILILVWIYYSSQILFLGAEFTKVYAMRNGKKIVPSRYAMFY